MKYLKHTIATLMDFHSNSCNNAMIAVSERDEVGRLPFLHLPYASLALRPCASSGHGERRREGKGGV